MRKLKKYKPTRFMAEDSHYDKAEAECLRHERSFGVLMQPCMILQNHTPAAIFHAILILRR